MKKVTELKKKAKTWKDFSAQQLDFLRFYLDPKSETWNDVPNSARRANFSETYAINLKNKELTWLEDLPQDDFLIKKAVRNLSKFVDDEENKNIQWDATKFTLTTLKKDKFSTRQELTGKDGEKISSVEINVRK